jgi:ethanolamine utilization protein EutN
VKNVILGRVVGKVISTKKDEKLVGGKLQIVIPVDTETLEKTGRALVAVDTVGAGEEELVLVVTGSSARLTSVTRDTPVDSAIIAIVDTVEVHGKVTYGK